MINLILMPLSVTNGMAGSKRVGNFLPYFQNDINFKLTNIILSSSTSNINSSLSKQIEQINFQDINSFIQPFRVCGILKNLFRVDYKNIIYYYGYPDFINILYLSYAKKWGYKIIFDIVENNFVIKNFNSFKTRIRNFSSHFFFNRLNTIADGAICISSQLEMMIKKNISSSFPVLILPITIIKEKFFQPLTEEYSRRIIKIFYGGSYGLKDGLNFLLNAFDIIADQYDVELLLTGKGNPKDEKKIIALISKIKNKNRIKKLGYLNDEGYYALLLSADIHCMTRTSSEFANYGFPFKLGEMLATGKPVIATKVGDVTKYVSEGEALLIEPESIDAIVTAIKFIIENHDKSILIGKAGRACAFRNFDAEKHALRLSQFLEEL